MSSVGKRLPVREWLPRHDRMLRLMWPDPWQWTIDEIAEGLGLGSDKREVFQRVAKLKLGKRPTKTTNGKYEDWLRERPAEVRDRWARVRACRIRRLNLRRKIQPAVVAGPPGGFACPGRMMAPEVAALVAAALRRFVVNQGAQHA